MKIQQKNHKNQSKIKLNFSHFFRIFATISRFFHRKSRKNASGAGKKTEIDDGAATDREREREREEGKKEKRKKKSGPWTKFGSGRIGMQSITHAGPP